jgi:hypothetical protein
MKLIERKSKSSRYNTQRQSLKNQQNQQNQETPAVEIYNGFKRKI